MGGCYADKRVDKLSGYFWDVRAPRLSGHLSGQNVRLRESRYVWSECGISAVCRKKKSRGIPIIRSGYAALQHSRSG